MGEREPLTRDQAERCYDVLVEHGGASSNPGTRESFIAYVTKPSAIEWRFMGHFGFGGKFYCGDYGPPRIGYYREHHTRARDLLVEIINAKIADIMKSPA